MSRHRPEHRDQMTPAAWGWLGALTLIAAVLRLYGLGRFSLWYDESHTLYLMRFVPHPLDLFRLDNNAEAPIMAVLTWAWHGLVRAWTDFPLVSMQQDFLIRLLPCVFSIACVPLVFLVARALFRDTLGGLLAAFLCAVSPFQVYYAQELRVYSAYTALALVGVYFLYRVVEQERHADFIALATVEVLLMYTHFFSVWALFCFNLFVLFVLPFQRSLFLRWTLYQAGVLIVILPMLYMAWHMDREMSLAKYGYFARPEWGMPLITFKAFFAGYGLVPWDFHGLTAARVLTLLGLGLVALGLFVLHLRPKWLLLAFLLLVVPVGVCTLIWRTHDYSFYQHRLFILSGAVAYMLAGLGLAMLPKPMRVLGVAVIAVCTAPFLGETYAGRLHPEDAHVQGLQDKIDMRSAARYIDEYWRDGDLVVHASLFTTFPMFHYLADKAQRHLCETEEQEIDFPLGTRNEPIFRKHGLLPVQYEKVIPEYKRFWVLLPDPSRRTFYVGPMHEVLGRTMALESHQEFDGLHVYLFAPAPKPAETPAPTEAPVEVPGELPVEATAP